MVFAEDVAKVAEQVRRKTEVIVGEEATKMGLIVPFFNALGYDVFDPTEVIPEFIADFATKKAGQLEKVDYAIAINGTIVMVVEAKAWDKKPEAHDGQLKRYFNGLLSTRIAIVTNGIEYRFFTDLRHENVMDEDPFFSFNILNYEQKQIENLKLFHRDNFDAGMIKLHAEEMVYLKGMNQLISHLLRTPSEELVRFLVSQLGTIAPNYAIEGRITSRIIEKFRPIVKKSIQNSLVELMTQSISREMDQPSDIVGTPIAEEPEAVLELEIEEIRVETTEEELSVFAKVQAIAQKSTLYTLPVQYKDVVSYFGLNVGKVSWWFLRFYLSSKKKSFVTRLPIEEVRSLAPNFEVQEMSASLGDAATRVTISSIEELDSLSGLILRCYEVEASKHPTAQVA